MAKNPHAMALGRLGGRVTSEAKAHAARENGKRGGKSRAKLFLELFETLGNQNLLEMANAIQKYTGLPGVVYFCTLEEMKNKQAHGLGRIKWIYGGKEAFVTIKPGKDGKRKSAGDPRMILDLEKFVSKNESLLWAYWNTPKDEADAVETIKNFKKV